MKLNKITFGEPHTLKRWFLYAGIFIALNIVIFLILNKVGFIHFSEIDDFFIQNLVNGAFGDHYIFFQQSNVALNWTLASLYKAIPSVNWYGVVYLILLTLSASFTGAVIVDKFSLPIGLPVYLAIMPVYYGTILLNFTYTTISYGILAASFVCLIHGFFTSQIKLRRALYIISGILFLISVLIRYEVIYSAFVYVAAIVIWLLVRYKKKSLYAILTIAVSFVAIGCFFAADNAYYASDEELSYYLRFNKARTNLEDKAPLTYDLYTDVFTDMDWTATDAVMIDNFYIPDDEKFGAQSMEYIYDNMKPTRYNRDLNAIRSQLLSTFGDNYLYGNILLFVFLILVWLTNKNIWTRLFSLLIVALPYIFYALFIILWRALFRVVYPHFIMSIIILPILINQTKFENIAGQIKNLKDNPIRPAAVVAAVVAAFAAAGLSNMFLRAKYAEDQRVVNLQSETRYAQDAFESMKLNSNYAYIYAPGNPLLSANECYGIFDVIEKDSLSNIQLLGGWTSQSPQYNDFKERYSIKSLPDGLLDNDKMLFIAPNDNFTRQYFAQKYGIEIELEEVLPLGHEMKAYKVKSISKS